MELEVSRRTLGWSAGVLALVALILLGQAVTPVDGNGGVLVLSPSYVATVRYLKTVQGWLKHLENVEGKIADVLRGEGNFYKQGQDAENAFEAVASIAAGIQQRQPPPALTLLQLAVSECAAAYVNTARLTLAFVSEPSEANKGAASSALETAREGTVPCDCG